MIKGMNLIRKLFAREGLSLAGILIVMSIFTMVTGVALGNWMIRTVAGPGAEEAEVVQQEQQWEEEVIPQEPEEPVPPVEELREDEEEIVSPEDTYMVQAGVFNSRDNAQRLKSLLEEEGFQVWVTDSQPYRVHLGVFSNRRDAEEIRDEAERKGFEVFIAH